MICHKHKCILVHIPRCAGSSMERTILGRNWVGSKISNGAIGGGVTTQHLLASTAKNLYHEHWEDYFKFSFVRNPWSRMVSLAQCCENFYKAKIVDGKLDPRGYIQQYPDREIDARSISAHKSLQPYKPAIMNAVYLNTLDEELDYIGRFENLQDDWKHVCDVIGIKNTLFGSNGSKKPVSSTEYTKYYDDETREQIAQRYAKDIEYFGYKFGE